ncbi:MAG: DUF2236 domain-containing protein [Pseudomonadales bacterium]|nr:DUF2236 domain-containing protein [Pseudomonadales bacterium]
MRGDTGNQTFSGKSWRHQWVRYWLARHQVSDEQRQSHQASLYLGDALADAWADWILDHSLTQGMAWLQKGLDRSCPDSELPAELRALLTHWRSTPAWVDYKRCRRASLAIRRSGWFAELALRNVALMSSYLSGAANKPLVQTGELKQTTARRLVETGSFWVDVTRIDGLKPGGRGWISAAHVRVMHAVTRQRMLRSKQWDETSWGIPINQGDMVATLLLFSSVFVSALQGMGLVFSSQEVADIIHLWRYTGYLMGIDPALLPSDPADCDRLLALQLMHFTTPDQDTQRLGAALAAVPMQLAGPGKIAQTLAQLESAYRSAVSRLVLGNEFADALGLPKPWYYPAALLTYPALRTVESFRRRTPGSTWLFERFGFWLHEKRVQDAVATTHADIHFQLRPALTENS